LCGFDSIENIQTAFEKKIERALKLKKRRKKRIRKKIKEFKKV